MAHSSDSSQLGTQPHIAIIGGGLGGLSLGICLLRRHVPFHIYEAAPSFGEIGAGIMCGPHAGNALRLISPNLLTAFHEHVTTNQDESDLWRWGTLRFGMDGRADQEVKMSDVEWEVFPDDIVLERLKLCGTKGMSSIHRARFLDSMIKLIPKDKASFSKVLHRLEQHDDGVHLYFADGTEVTADAVVGCDGIKSKVRASIMNSMGKSVEPQYAGEYGYRSLIDISVAEKLLGPSLAGNLNLWEGRGTYLIHYPVEKGRMVNVVGVVRDTQIGEDQSYEKLVKSVPREIMHHDFEGWDPRVQTLLQEFKTSDQWSLWDLIHEEKYFEGRICILGDAAHASVPHLGSGAAVAIEDAYILGSLLADSGASANTLAVFTAYDAVRRPRTQKLAAKSREAGLKHTLSLPGILDDSTALKGYSEQQYRWLWKFDLEHQLREARRMVAGLRERPEQA